MCFFMASWGQTEDRRRVFFRSLNKIYLCRVGKFKVNATNIAICENWTSKSSEQRNSKAKGSNGDHRAVHEEESEGRKQQGMNRQKKSKGEKAFLAKKKPYSWKLRIWFRTNNVRSILLLRHARIEEWRHFGRIVFKVSVRTNSLPSQNTDIVPKVYILRRKI